MNENRIEIVSDKTILRGKKKFFPKVKSCVTDDRLRTEDLEDGKNFLVLQDIEFTMVVDYGDRVMTYLIRIFEGDITDLASTPFFMAKLTKGNKYFVLHDILYRLNPMNLGQIIADQAMRKGLLHGGLVEWRANIRYVGIVLVGFVTFQKYRRNGYKITLSADTYEELFPEEYEELFDDDDSLL